MGARADATRRTREAILDAAEIAFDGRWFDEVTLGDVARAAGVTQQTVVNHFGAKENLYLVGLSERVAPRLRAARTNARAGDLRSVVAAVVDEYETYGAGTLRVLALADRYPTLGQVAAGGREFHRRWVDEMLKPGLDRVDVDSRSSIVDLASVWLDVRTWYQVRHEHGHDIPRTTDLLLGELERLVGDPMCRVTQ